ncbi:MAG: glycosyltransferase family 4 protein [Clostridiales bacterium]|nr:glycosyltransferase family 4 protein [Clostridiales bacterium]
MKIAITTVQIPYITGGAEFLAANLKQALITEGHEAEIVTMPFIDQPGHFLENHIVASRLMDINNSWGGHVDLCIGLKFPAYFMPHDNKVVWALHQHRQAYELFDTEYSPLKNDDEGRYYRTIVKNADNKYLPEAKRIYTIAQNVSNRMQRFNGIASTPLYHPCPDMDQFFADDYEDYILMPSRINMTKRQKLAVEALALTKSKIKLYIVGHAENPFLLKEIQDLIAQHKLGDRVKIMDFIPQEEKIKLYSRARAVLFIPKDEDYGYITLEAMAAARPVITCRDSGGPLEFLLDNKTGKVCEPDPKDIAEAIDAIAGSSEQAKEMGTMGRKHLDEMEISWKKVVEELTRP